MKNKRQKAFNKRARKPGLNHRTATGRPQRWLPIGLILTGAILLIALFVILPGRAGAQNVVPPRMGAPLSNFALNDTHGQKVQLSDYAGQVVLVNSWATWCPPCKAEMPDLNAYFQTHKERGFVVLAINAGDPADAAAEFAQSNDLAFPVLLDPNTRLLSSFGIHSFPTSIVVGRDGLVKTIHLGMYSPADLEADITPLLAE